MILSPANRKMVFNVSRRALCKTVLPALAVSLVGSSHCGRTQTRTGPVRRWVSLAPNTTELLFAMGFGSRVVGVSTSCDFPAETSTITKVGSFATVSVEAILARRPDAVVGVTGLRSALIERLTQLGLRVCVRDIESAAQIVSVAKELALLSGDRERGERWSQDFMRALQQQQSLHAQRPEQERPSVLALVNQSPMIAAGPHSFVNELLTFAGARNVLTTGPTWPQLSMEAILPLQPLVVLDLTGSVETQAIQRAWSTHTALRAVQKQNIFTLADPLVTRPGPRMPQAVALIAQALNGTHQ